MPCPPCEANLPSRERIILQRFDLAAKRREKCEPCEANNSGQCVELGLPVIELTKQWNTSCPRGQFAAVRQACPGCNRAEQFLSRSSLCQWCEIDRENKRQNEARRTRVKVRPRAVLTRDYRSLPALPLSVNQLDGRSVVWVYWEGGQRNNELWHSIQLAQRHLRDSGKFAICGDIPSWYSGYAIRSLRISDSETKKAMGDTRYKKWLDSIVKLRKIIDDPKVTDSFLWLYDDTFIVREATISELGVPRYSGELKRSSRSTWRLVMAKTADALRGEGLPSRNYSTHYPIVFDKQKLQQTIDRFSPDRHPLLIESLYQNQWASHPQPHGGEFQYTQQVRSGWTPKPSAIVVNVGQFNQSANIAISQTMAVKAVTCIPDVHGILHSGSMG